MPQDLITISHASRNMIASLHHQASSRILDEATEKVQNLAFSPDRRRIEGYDNLYFMADDEYLVIFEMRTDDILIRSVAEAAAYPGLTRRPTPQLPHRLS
jgi:hypothetical protein